MSETTYGILEEAPQPQPRDLTDNRPPKPRSFFFSMLFFFGIVGFFAWQMARNDNPMWTVAKPLAQPVTRPTQAQAIQQAAQVQASPTAPALATPTMQPTQAPVEIRPTLEMGTLPTRETVQDFDPEKFEKQIELQEQQRKNNEDYQKFMIWLAEQNQRIAWGWFWLFLAFLAALVVTVIIISVYVKGIVFNLGKASELAKSRQNAPQATTKAVEPRRDENAIQTPSDYLTAMEDDNPPCKWDFFTEWVEQADGDNVPNTAMSESAFGGQAQWRAVRDWMLHSRRVFMTRESPTSGFVFTPAFWDWYGR